MGTNRDTLCVYGDRCEEVKSLLLWNTQAVVVGGGEGGFERRWLREGGREDLRWERERLLR